MFSGFFSPVASPSSSFNSDTPPCPPLSLSVSIQFDGTAVKRAAGSEYAYLEFPFPGMLEAQLLVIAHGLQDAGCKVHVYLPPTSLCRPIFSSDHPDYSVWNVTTEVIDHNAEPDYVMVTMPGTSSAMQPRVTFRVQSPIVYTSAEDWQRELQVGIASIAQVVDWHATGSLHVHVGRGSTSNSENGGYTLDEVKKIAMFCCRFEGVIDNFHPVPRRDHGEYHCMSNRKNGLLGPIARLRQVYERIWAAENIMDVCKIVNYCPDNDVTYNGLDRARFFKVNFTSLNKHDTIEFRQHKGIDDPQEVLEWVLFVLKLVTFATEAPIHVVAARGNTFEDLVSMIGPGTPPRIAPIVIPEEPVPDDLGTIVETDVF
ncbi:hypothetical protein QBC46DRAFT_409313 [Diplogelasinospora grovesii]|uniref:Uncharacterized protein n=1 Tax=Diplogelasinospora grovesii TaxID=303347 RepID=A0AAN6S3M7_9PEZI|nr:hypothetical protein QBC46DRAFT_409313 [Diplogelasinospora grovesii]